MVRSNRFFVGVGAGDLAATGHEHPRHLGAFAFLALEVRPRPEHGPVFIKIGIRNLPNDETLDLARLIAINDVNGPGPFEMKSWFQHGVGACGPAEMFQQPLLVRLDDDEHRREKQRAELQQNDQKHRLFEKLENPGLGDFETKLVVERLRRRGDQPAGLAEQSDEPALVKQPCCLAFDARTIDFQHQTNERFDGRQPEDNAQSISHKQINLRETKEGRRLGPRHKETNTRAQDQVPGAGP